MAIMGILFSVAIPKVSDYILKANKTKVISAVSVLNSFVISSEIDNKNINDLQTLLSNYSNISKLNIGLDQSGNFTIGKIKGHLIFEDGVVKASIDEPFNEIVGPNQWHIYLFSYLF